MWPAFDLVNKGVFMELEKSETDWAVPETEGVQNGVSLDVYEGEIQEKKPWRVNEKRERKKNEKKKGEIKKKN